MVGACWGLIAMVTESKRRLAENLARIRKQRGLTQDAVARAVGVTPGSVSHWENPKSEIGIELDKLDLLARVLDCDVAEFTQRPENAKDFKPLKIPPPKEPTLQEALKVVNKSLAKLALKKVNRKKAE